MTNDNLRLYLLELSEQLRCLLVSNLVDNAEDREQQLRRLRNTALATLAETGLVLDREKAEAITLQRPDPVWCPAITLQERLRARRQRPMPVDPFAAPHPRRPRL